MKRRTVLPFACAMLASPKLLRAQARRPFRIGWFVSGRKSDPMSLAYVQEFRARLAELGYVEEKDFIVDIRFGEADAARFPDIAEQLIAQKPDVLVGIETSSRAMVAKTRSIPIVLTTSVDPVGAGLVRSLAKPGTNVTGMVDQYDQLIAKQIELLVDLAPNARRLGLLIDPLWSGRKSYEDFARKAADAKRLSLTVAELAVDNDLQKAFGEFEKKKIEILLISTQAKTAALRREIAVGARRLRIPAIFGFAMYPEAGGLLSYGPDIFANMRPVAEMVDQILKGAKPADMPLRQTAKFEMVLNQRAAREIGLTIPQSIMLRADRVIE